MFRLHVAVELRRDRDVLVSRPEIAIRSYTLVPSKSLAIHPFFAEKIPPEHRPKWALKDLTDIGAVMTRHVEDDRLLRAAQWLFDSYAATNPLLAFVQATTSLEILLGDKMLSDLVGLGALLGNRCAFLTASLAASATRS